MPEPSDTRVPSVGHPRSVPAHPQVCRLPATAQNAAVSTGGSLSLAHTGQAPVVRGSAVRPQPQPDHLRGHWVWGSRCAGVKHGWWWTGRAQALRCAGAVVPVLLGDPWAESGGGRGPH